MAPSPAPRYQQVAAELRAAIASGEYPVGALLPTEQDLCGRFAISRHTAREALRLLSIAGLVARKRRAGTVVVAQSEPPVFVQPLDGYGDLLQYARDARLVVEGYDVGQPNPLAATLKLEPAQWVRVLGRRGKQGRSVGLTTILLRRDCAPPRGALDGTAAVADVVERQFGLTPSRIDQQVSAALLDRAQAAKLDADAHAPALRTVRLYYDGAGRLYMASETIHPADRFVYTMTFTRERGA